MTVSNGSQYLDVYGFSSSRGPPDEIWEVEFVNSSNFNFYTFISGVNHDSGSLACANGIVQVSVNAAGITFLGSTSSFVSFQDFQNVGQIRTENGDGNFNSGVLNINVH